MSVTEDEILAAIRRGLMNVGKSKRPVNVIGNLEKHAQSVFRELAEILEEEKE